MFRYASIKMLREWACVEAGSAVAWLAFISAMARLGQHIAGLVAVDTHHRSGLHTGGGALESDRRCGISEWVL